MSAGEMTVKQYEYRHMIEDYMGQIEEQAR